MYYIVYSLLYLISLLPLRVLYILSDILYLIGYRLVGYRRKVVLNTLEIAFPEKSLAERQKIAGKFYHDLIDCFIDTHKIVSASDPYIQKRVSGNWEVLS